MKTEKQVTDNLEKQVEAFVALVKSVETRDPTEDERVGIIALFSALCSLGWVLDCEAEIKHVLMKIKIAGLAEKFPAFMGRDVASLCDRVLKETE